VSPVLNLRKSIPLKQPLLRVFCLFAAFCVYFEL
jgi:hypothetical protein